MNVVSTPEMCWNEWVTFSPQDFPENRKAESEPIPGEDFDQSWGEQPESLPGSPKACLEYTRTPPKNPKPHSPALPSLSHQLHPPLRDGLRDYEGL